MANESTSWVSGVRHYLRDVRGEVDKITWPQREEAIAGTVGVVAVVALIATVLGFVDFGLSRIMQVILQ